MTRLSAQDFDQELLILFDAYVHGGIDRRGFLDGAQKYAVAGVTATMLLAALSPDFARAQQVSDRDERLKTDRLEYDSPQGSGRIKAYLARPAQPSGKLPAILVVHENRGLNPHIEDVVRRLALHNYLVLAPDALSPLGGYPGDEDKAREMFARLDQTKTREDFVAAAHYLQSRQDSDGKLGCIGFCYGGGVVHVLSALLSDLNAAVSFYGNQPAAAQAAQVKAPLLVHLAGTDERINAGWPVYEAALQAAGVRYSVHQYPGTQHGFNNDTTPRFDAANAQLAWQRTLAFFAENLNA